MDIKGFRKDYKSPVLKKHMLAPDPFKQFELWFNDACNNNIAEPNAMTLATVNAAGHPSQRTVLLKLFDIDGFVFFTNYKSRKAKEMAENSHVSLLFPWIPLERQVTVMGVASKVTATESAKYFASRPRASQIGAWISNQSSIITSRNLLLTELEKAKNKFLQGKIPLPDFWGGYRVVPQSIEFWQGRTSRLHDRFLYTKSEAGFWTVERLAP